MHKLNLFIHMLTGFNHLLLIHKICLEGFSFQQMSTQTACLYFCLKVRHHITHVFCSSYHPSIHPKAFKWVQPCGKQGNHVKRMLDSTNDCRQAPSQWLSNSKLFVKCILFPHEEIPLLFFNYVQLMHSKSADGKLNKIDLQGNCSSLKCTFISFKSMSTLTFPYRVRP